MLHLLMSVQLAKTQMGDHALEADQGSFSCTWALLLHLLVHGWTRRMAMSQQLTPVKQVVVRALVPL